MLYALCKVSRIIRTEREISDQLISFMLTEKDLKYSFELRGSRFHIRLTLWRGREFSVYFSGPILKATNYKHESSLQICNSCWVSESLLRQMWETSRARKDMRITGILSGLKCLRIGFNDREWKQWWRSLQKQEFFTGLITELFEFEQVCRPNLWLISGPRTRALVPVSVLFTCSSHQCSL
jgi:hypothetical protein